MTASGRDLPASVDLTRGPIAYRKEVRPSDRDVVRDLVSSSGIFLPAERDLAVALLDERLAQGIRSGYHFLFAQRAGAALGYACFGPIPITAASFDLYWIVVRERSRGLGLGRALLARCERRIGELGGRRIYVETSSREPYGPARGLYRAAGYRKEAILPEFYGPGDAKVIFHKALP